MKKLGYETAVIGKWHLKDEPGAFDYYKVLPGQGKYYDPIFRVRGEKEWGKNTIQYKGKHSSDAITDVSIEWLKNGRDKAKPFFLKHHFKAPHDMFENAKRYDSYLENVEIPEPANLHNQPAPGFGSTGSRGTWVWFNQKSSIMNLSGRLGVDQNMPDDDLLNGLSKIPQEVLKMCKRCR